MDDELDIYDDLDEFQEIEEKKSKELLALEEKYKAAEVEIEGLKAQNNKLVKQIKQMEVNLQNLLDTAKAEVKRKETLIAELRKEKDDICFRRKRARGFEDSVRENVPNQKRPKPDKVENVSGEFEKAGPIATLITQDEFKKSVPPVDNVEHGKPTEKHAKGSSHHVDKSTKRKSRSPSPGHSRKPSAQHRSNDSRNREREREKERDRERERERERRHERERRRSRSPKRSYHDDRPRNRVSNEMPSQSRRHSSSRSQQRTASSGSSRDPSSNRHKSDTIKSLFGEETNDQDEDFKPNTEIVTPNEIKPIVEHLTQPQEQAKPADAENSKTAQVEIKAIKQKEIDKHSETLSSLEPLTQTNTPGKSVRQAKTVISKFEDARKSEELPQIPGLDLITCEKKTSDPNPTQIIESKYIQSAAVDQSNRLSKQRMKPKGTQKYSKYHGTTDKCRQDAISVDETIVTETEKAEKTKTCGVKVTKEVDDVDCKERSGKEPSQREIDIEPERKDAVKALDVKASKKNALEHKQEHAKKPNLKEIESKENKSLRTGADITINSTTARSEDPKKEKDPKKAMESEQTHTENAIEPERKESVIVSETKMSKENTADNTKQIEIVETVTENVIDLERKEAVSVSDEKVLEEVSDYVALDNKQNEKAQIIIDDSSTESVCLIHNKAEKELGTVVREQSDESSGAEKPPEENKESHTLNGCIESHKILQAGQITPRRKPGLEVQNEEYSELADEDKPTPKRPSPVKKLKVPTTSISKKIDFEDPATTKPSIQIIEDIRLPVKMDIEHIAVRVDGVDENVEIPLPASVQVLSMSKPSTIMYAQPDSTKIDHNDNDMALEPEINEITALEEKNVPLEDQMNHQLNQTFSIEIDTLESALEQLHQTSPDESIVTSTSTKAQPNTAKQDLIKILSHESPIKLPKTEVEKATEKTPLKKRKINLAHDSEITPTTQNQPPIEPQIDQQHVTIDETQDLSGSFNTDSSIVTKRCSLGQSDYQFERINDEVILRVTRRGRRRKPPCVEVKQN